MTISRITPVSRATSNIDAVIYTAIREDYIDEEWAESTADDAVVLLQWPKYGPEKIPTTAESITEVLRGTDTADYAPPMIVDINLTGIDTLSIGPAVLIEATGPKGTVISVDDVTIVDDETILTVTELSGRHRLFLTSRLEYVEGDEIVYIWSDIENATYDDKYFDISLQETNALGMHVKPDGTALYIVGASHDSIFQYALTTPWDITTAVYVEKYFTVTEESAPMGLLLDPTGSIMFIIGTHDDTIYQYTLDTPWDISTASYDDKSFNVHNKDDWPVDIEIDPSGTKLYFIGNLTHAIYQYTLDTPWDISTASYDDKSFSIAEQELTPGTLLITTNGAKMFVLGYGVDTVFQYTLTTPWDITTAVYDNTSFSVAEQDGTPHSVAFNPNGSSMYILGGGNDRIYQYGLETSYTGTYVATMPGYFRVCWNHISDDEFERDWESVRYLGGNTIVTFPEDYDPQNITLLLEPIQLAQAPLNTRTTHLNISFEYPVIHIDNHGYVQPIYPILNHGSVFVSTRTWAKRYNSFRFALPRWAIHINDLYQWISI